MGKQYRFHQLSQALYLDSDIAVTFFVSAQFPKELGSSEEEGNNRQRILKQVP